MLKGMNVLLAEDDDNLSLIMCNWLQEQGYTVTVAADGKKALSLFLERTPHIVLADVMMPHLNGFDLLHQIRQHGFDLPVILITARSLPEDKLHGLRLGADDYLVKPFSLEELGLKIGRMLRRTHAPTEVPGIFSFGISKLDTRNRTLQVANTMHKLTNKECMLLEVLLAHKANLVSRDSLLIQVWGGNDYFSGRSMDVYISKLRKYLKPDTKVNIVNYHSTGFRLMIDEED